MDAKDIGNKLLVVVGGPTGIGKTTVSIQLAQHYQTEIVNADSRQVYKELDIGVAKPSTAQLSLVPHHLISHVSIHDHYSAGHYTTDALNIIYTLFARHDVVILSGGTGLYIKSVIEGFDRMPDIPVEVTNHWSKIWELEGTEPLIKILRDADPDYLAVVDQSNYSRLIRAVSVCMFTRKPFSSFRLGLQPERLFSIAPIVLDLPRNELYQRIENRVLEMVKLGLQKEAKELYPFKHLKALQTVGYKELFDVMDGLSTLEKASPKIQQSTRQYAKRQLTWFRNQGRWHTMDPGDISGMIVLIDSLRKDVIE
ncbi:MAG: tRNA (adenosine(37)-N6)-dimethylallyltransferase MiaA [Saprospiraceae bacterium]